MRKRYIIIVPFEFGYLYYKDGGYSFTKRFEGCKGFYNKQKAEKQLKEAKLCNEKFEILCQGDNRMARG